LFGQYGEGYCFWGKSTSEFDGEGAGWGGVDHLQLGLGFSYSRGEFKFNPARSDAMIIHEIVLLDQMDRYLNNFAIRVKIWYSYHFPELRIIVKDYYMFVNCTVLIHDKRSLFSLTISHDDNQEVKKTEEYCAEKLPGLIKILGTMRWQTSFSPLQRLSWEWNARPLRTTPP